MIDDSYKKKPCQDLGLCVFFIHALFGKVFQGDPVGALGGRTVTETSVIGFCYRNENYYSRVPDTCKFIPSARTVPCLSHNSSFDLRKGIVGRPF